MQKKFCKKGFTLIELLIVIAIIAILATIVVVSYAGAQKKSRDNKRKADIQSIASAYQIYNQETKAWYIPGTGASGAGNGWFNYEDGVSTSYPKSMAHGLEEGGYLNPAPRDPLQKNGNDGANGYRYMKYQTPCLNGAKTTIFAKLEVPNDQEMAEARLGCAGSLVDNANYLMSYAVTLK
jgi:prepilin-type N-terminal cleavage/methylation domain-containing protein